MFSAAAGRTDGTGRPEKCRSTIRTPLGLNGIRPADADSTPGSAAIRLVSVSKNQDADVPRSGNCIDAVQIRSAEKPSGTSTSLMKLLVNAVAVNSRAIAMAIYPATRMLRQPL